jgi:hypothetical protein
MIGFSLSINEKNSRLFLAARMIGFQKSLSLSKLNGVW